MSLKVGGGIFSCKEKSNCLTGTCLVLSHVGLCTYFFLYLELSYPQGCTLLCCWNLLGSYPNGIILHRHSLTTLYKCYPHLDTTFPFLLFIVFVITWYLTSWCFDSVSTIKCKLHRAGASSGYCLLYPAIGTRAGQWWPFNRYLLTELAWQNGYIY